MHLPSRTDISTLGEHGLIDRINTRVSPFTSKHCVQGIGDDAAVLKQNGNDFSLFCTDMLTEGVHFDLRYTPLQHLGYKSISVNVSDIVAMNGVAKYALVALGISNRFSVEDIDLLYEGVTAACKRYNISVVGGDIVSSKTGLSLSVSILGHVAADKVSYRSGAQTGDVLCLTGDIGAAYVGLEVLQRQLQKKAMTEQDLKPYTYAIGRQLKPEARTDLVEILAQQHIRPTAMIDLSDGLYAEVAHICKASGVGAYIKEKQLPVADEICRQANELNLSLGDVLCYGGEDYEILFTLSPSDYQKIHSVRHIHSIGYIQEKNILLEEKRGNIRPLTDKNWRHL